MPLPVVQYGHYLNDCKYRAEHSAAAGVAVCGLVREKIGVDHPVNPKLCAECMLYGTQDDNFIKSTITKLMTEIAINAKLGFYNNEDDILEIFRLGFKHTNDEIFGNLLVECVELGRVSTEKAKKLILEINDAESTRKD